MRLNLRLLPVVYVGFAVLCGAEPRQAAPQSTPANALQTDDQKILYTLGQILGRDIESARLSEQEMASVLLGISDSALHRPAKVNIDQYGPMLQAFMDGHIKAAAAVELKESEAFLEEQAKVQGAVRTPSGIILREITPGTGDTPTAQDTVKVHYHGTLRDGSVFDSSVNRGQPATFRLNQVIPCWTEGVQHIKVGGKTRLVCPPNLAYGADGRPGIPGNAVLTFEVELLEIVKN
jgi:FKBP-type peptidyl-prolyl cis-trans isomerase FkpA